MNLCTGAYLKGEAKLRGGSSFREDEIEVKKGVFKILKIHSQKLNGDMRRESKVAVLERFKNG